MSEQPIVEYLTQEAFDRLQAELEQRRTTGRTEVTAKIEVARAHGDLRENAEYHAAKEEQGQNEARIRVLEEKLRTAIVGTPPQAAEGKVTAGMVLEVEEDGDVSEIYLGSREDQPAGLMVVSAASPMGVALVGSNVGDTVSYSAPGGRFEVTVRSAKLLGA